MPFVNAGPCGFSMEKTFQIHVTITEECPNVIKTCKQVLLTILLNKYSCFVLVYTRARRVISWNIEDGAILVIQLLVRIIKTASFITSKTAKWKCILNIRRSDYVFKHLHCTPTVFFMHIFYIFMLCYSIRFEWYAMSFQCSAMILVECKVDFARRRNVWLRK